MAAHQAPPSLGFLLLGIKIYPTVWVQTLGIHFSTFHISKDFGTTHVVITTGIDKMVFIH